MKKGFAISGIMYPMMILFLVLVLLILASLMQGRYLLNRVTNDTMQKINEEDGKGLLKQEANRLLEEGTSCVNHEVKDGTYLGYNGEELNYHGRYYTMQDGRTAVLLDDGTYCAYKLTSYSNIRVQESGTCDTSVLRNDCTGAGLICPACPTPTGAATAKDVKKGVTFWNANSGKQETGTMEEKVCPTCPTPTGSATAKDVKKGVTFWNASSGKQETGTMESAYAGYRVVYDTKTLAEVQALGGIPLTVKWYIDCYITMDDSRNASIQIYSPNGNRSFSKIIEADAGSRTDGRRAKANGNVDIDLLYNGDLTAMKNITSITVEKYSNLQIYNSSVTIVKYLVPIS